MRTWKSTQKGGGLQLENMKTNAKRMGVDWKQEDQHEKDFLHLENKKTNAKKRIVVPYSLKTQRPMWKEKGPIGKYLQKNNNCEFHNLNVKLL